MNQFRLVLLSLLLAGSFGEALAGTATPTVSTAGIPVVEPPVSNNNRIFSFFSKNDYGEQVNDTDLLTNLGIDISTSGKMKDHFRKGMRFFLKDQWEAATPELIASTVIVDPYTWSYWYAEAYATLGVIYEFHNTDPNHNDMAYLFYRLALKRDPKTFSARHFLKNVSPKKFAKTSQQGIL